MRKKFLLALIIFITIFSFGEKADAIENRGKNVFLIENGIVKNYLTNSETVKEFLCENKINFGAQDYINKKMDAEILNGMNIEIGHPFKLKVFVDDIENYFHVGFNDEIVDLKKILKSEYKKDFICEQASGCKLRNCRDLKFYSHETKLIDTTEKIPFETEIVSCDDIDCGQEKIVQDGVNGEKIITEEIVCVNNQEISRVFKSEKIIKEPIKKIIKTGTGKSVNRKIKSVLKMNASAYTAGFESTGKRPGDKNYGITATGTKVKHGTVAVDPKIIPLGTDLYVEGYGYAKALDTGGAIKGNKIDLFYNSLYDAKRFGRKNLTVYVLS